MAFRRKDLYGGGEEDISVDVDAERWRDESEGLLATASSEVLLVEGLARRVARSAGAVTSIVGVVDVTDTTDCVSSAPAYTHCRRITHVL